MLSKTVNGTKLKTETRQTIFELSFSSYYWFDPPMSSICALIIQFSSTLIFLCCLWQFNLSWHFFHYYIFEKQSIISLFLHRFFIREIISVAVLSLAPFSFVKYATTLGSPLHFSNTSREWYFQSPGDHPQKLPRSRLFFFFIESHDRNFTFSVEEDNVVQMTMDGDTNAQSTKELSSKQCWTYCSRLASQNASIGANPLSEDNTEEHSSLR